MTASEGKLSRFLAKFCNCAYTIGYIYLEGIVYTMLLNLVWYLMNGWGRFVCSVCINKLRTVEREREITCLGLDVGETAFGKHLRE